MLPLRLFLSRHLWACAVLVALALVMKAFVPTGFMIGSTPEQVLSVEICDGQGHTELKKIAVPGKPDANRDAHAKAAKECPFTALSAHSLSAAGPVLLALALAFILQLGFVAVAGLVLQRPRYVQPPLRAPPFLN